MCRHSSFLSHSSAGSDYSMCRHSSFLSHSSAGSDYVPVSQAIAVSRASSPACVVVMATKDGIVEWDEELGMQMRTAVPLVTLHPSSAVITILDTDGRHVRQPVGAVSELSLLPRGHHWLHLRAVCVGGGWEECGCGYCLAQWAAGEANLHTPVLTAGV